MAVSVYRVSMQASQSTSGISRLENFNYLKNEKNNLLFYDGVDLFLLSFMQIQKVRKPGFSVGYNQKICIDLV
jgi:hypothetical protein